MLVRQEELMRQMECQESLAERRAERSQRPSHTQFELGVATRLEAAAALLELAQEARAHEIAAELFYECGSLKASRAMCKEGVREVQELLAAREMAARVMYREGWTHGHAEALSQSERRFEEDAARLRRELEEKDCKLMELEGELSESANKRRMLPPVFPESHEERGREDCKAQ